MTTQVVSSIGTSSRNYSIMQSWEDAIAVGMTTTRSATTVAGSTSSTIVLDVLASGTNDFYTGLAIWCDARPTEKRLITAYNGTTKIATVGALNGSNATWDNTPGTEAFTIDAISAQGEAYNDSEFTNALTIAGQTTSSTSTITLTAAAGQSFADHADKLTNALRYNQSNGVGVRAANLGNLVYVQGVNNVAVKRLQIRHEWAGNYVLIALDVEGTSGQSTYIDQCLVESTAPFGGPGKIRVAKAYNSLFVSMRAGAGQPEIFRIEAGEAYNCTCVCPSDFTAATVGVAFQYSGNILKNCAVFGATFDTGGAGSGTFTTCATDDTSPSTGFTGSLTYADQFVTTTGSSRDFRAKSGGALINAGTDISGSEPKTATDIVGTARPQGSAYDIGCWELVAAASRAAQILLTMQAVNRASTY